ncbi:hypothetical protein BP6252_13115 [Coleophoma cylindrospora]|uniref:Erythromycin biosynthesis protein CIII-like C-terminal domain-containing protein n=1 Tax=Coleophoma cylindrospora TaxID=1849047 RepID=A0A3D8QA14_9HELO|nr:hypothetical protein BP6252_13115 [Coleophoma cylindrospora]
MDHSKKPFVLMSAFVGSHLSAVLPIAQNLVSQGYDVYFLTPTARRSMVEATGAKFVPLLGAADFTEEDFDSMGPGKTESQKSGPEGLIYDMIHYFLNPIPAQYESIQSALRDFKAKDASRPVVLLNEAAFGGALCVKLGASGLVPAGLISIGIVPLPITSADTAPFGPGLPPDSTPAGRERNIAMNQQILETLFKEPQEAFQNALKSTGASTTPYFFFDAAVRVPDRFVQMCHPALEYPRSDAPSNIVFAGSFPPNESGNWANRPEWWDDVAVNSEKKRIVFVCQGTFQTNYKDLILPTMESFREDPSVLVVAALGVRGSSIPSETVPANCRVVDFIPFEEILPYATVFVTNGGYGGVQKAISAGVPMVIGGASEDKPEVAGRAEWAGIGVNLRTATPTKEAVSEAVNEILGNPKYTQKVQEIAADLKKSYRPFATIAKAIDEIAAVYKDGNMS